MSPPRTVPPEWDVSGEAEATASASTPPAS
jgi:hypothetical protein